MPCEHGCVLALRSHVELVVLVATIVASIALGLGVARGTLLLVFSLVTRGHLALSGSNPSQNL